MKNRALITPLTALSERELELYKRQLMHRGFTPEHQSRLKTASVLVAGVGGLGAQRFVFNTFDMEYRKFRVRRNSSCPLPVSV